MLLTFQGNHILACLRLNEIIKGQFSWVVALVCIEDGMINISVMTNIEYVKHLDKSATVLKSMGQSNISKELREASWRIRKLMAENENQK